MAEGAYSAAWANPLANPLASHSSTNASRKATGRLRRTIPARKFATSRDLRAKPTPMNGYTGRSGFGKAIAGKPDPAKNSCAETDIVNVAAKNEAIVIRITSSPPCSRPSKTGDLKFF